MPQVATRRSVSFSEAKDHLSSLASEANASGEAFVVTRHHKPWIEIRPLAHTQSEDADIVIKPVHQRVDIPNLDELFAGYEGNYEPEEDGFANAAGAEEL